MRKLLISLLAVAGSFISVARAADTYNVDPAHTSLTFSVRHLGLTNVKGHFNEFTGSLTFDGEKLQSAQATIQVASIDTGVEQRNAHLRTADFFDAETYPEITFVTKRIEKDGDKTILVADFTMRGVTKELRLPANFYGPATDPWGNTRIGLTAIAKINRLDYNINYNPLLETGVAVVGEEISLEINAEAVKASAE
ncbi:YceI family protein [Actomonas aquatica]|uniref:YceI family protein n=1 Tax=Actomonas aquatica TaxID=2866162 RepID=A0ABZ1CBW1_9BACT|nr:YceI family protein [Opitutus sp. WL0086]WRQ88922.1 YceI family protein [Opitutus sp. WL0086]